MLFHEMNEFRCYKLTNNFRIVSWIGLRWIQLAVKSRATKRNVGQLEKIRGTLQVSRASLIFFNHANYVEELAWICLIIGNRLVTLVNDTLAQVRDLIPRHCISDRAIAWRFFEANCVIQSR